MSSKFRIIKPALAAWMLLLPYLALKAQENLSHAGFAPAVISGQPGYFCTNCDGEFARVGPEDEVVQKQYEQRKLLQAEMELYPVPAVNELTIKAPGNLKGKTRLMLFDTEGRAFFSENVTAEVLKDFKVDLDKINLCGGVYYVRLVNNGSTITKRFIKQ